MCSLPVRDAYDTLTRKLGYPASETLRQIMELVMTVEEAQLLVAMPGTIQVLSKKLNRDPKVAEDQIERMFWAGLCLETPDPNGSANYSMPSSLEIWSDQILRSLGGNFAPKTAKATAQDMWGLLDEKNQLLCDLWNKFFYEEWYRWQRPDELVHRRVELLGGSLGMARTFGMQPAVIALEKSEPLGTEILPDWDLREIAKKAEEKGVFSAACSCRMRNKGCDLPLWTCASYYDGQPGIDFAARRKADRRGIMHKYAAEEWLDMLVRAEEKQMIIHMGDSWMNCCNCCRDCCNWLVPLKLYGEPWEGVHPSPYRSVVNSDVCEGCTQDCFPRCALKVIEGVKDSSTGKIKAYVDPDKCVGCGQCVVGCKVEGAIRLELAEKAGAHVPVMGGRAKVPKVMPGHNPNIPRRR